jgi:hypothetical protein
VATFALTRRDNKALVFQISFSSDLFCETAALLLDRSSFPMRDMVEDAFFASASPGSDCVDLDEENDSNFEVDPLPGTNFKLE